MIPHDAPSQAKGKDPKDDPTTVLVVDAAGGWRGGGRCATKASNGVVIATEKKLPSVLVDEESVSKISLLTPQLGVAYSGMGPDSRVLVKQARKLAQAYYRLYKETIPVSQLVRETATVMQESTQQG